MSKLLTKLSERKVVFNRKKFSNLTKQEQMELAEDYYCDIEVNEYFRQIRSYIHEFNSFVLMLDYVLYPEFYYFVDNMQADILKLAKLRGVDIFLLSLHPVHGTPFYEFVDSFGTYENFASDWECRGE